MSGYVLTEQAERDLNEIWIHIAEQSFDTADAVVAEIRAALELLASSPGVGAPSARREKSAVPVLAREPFHHRVLPRHAAAADHPNRRRASGLSVDLPSVVAHHPCSSVPHLWPTF
jgi:plasmid stabilization system protein ParE